MLYHFNKSHFFIFAIAGLSLTLSGCLSSETSTDYKTNYTLNLKDIDSSIDLDSARIDILLNGILDTSIAVNAQSLDSRTITLPPIASEENDEIQVRYTIYSMGQIVANGTDTYLPSSQNNTPTPLQINSAVIRDLLASKNSSSSSTTNEYNIVFTTASSTAYENAEPTTPEFPQVSIEIVGPSNGTLPEDHEITLTISGSATQNDFSEIQTKITVPANSVVGYPITIPLAPIQDNLVEGTETLHLSINDPKSTGTTRLSHALTLQDADSAWVQFDLSTASIAEDASAAQPVKVQLHTKPLIAKLAAPIQVALKANANSNAIAGIDYIDPGTALSFLFSANQGEGDSKTIAITPKKVTGWNAATLLQLDLTVPTGAAQAKDNPLSITFTNTDYEYIAVLSPDNSTSKVTLISPDLSILKTYPIHDGGVNSPTAVALVLSANHDKVYAIQNSVGLWAYNTNTNAWSTPYTFQGSYDIQEAGMCADGKFSTVEYSRGSTYSMMYPAYGPLQATIDQETITSGSNPPLYYRPCLPTSLGKHGGLVLTPTALTRMDWNGTELAQNTLQTFSNASALAMLAISGVGYSEAAYVLDGTILHTVGVFGDMYDKSPIDLAATLGAGVSGARHMVETPRRTLLLFAPEYIYEFNPTDGKLIRSAKHNLGTIQDAEYIDSGIAQPQP